MAQAGIIDFVITEDSDLLVYGAPKVSVLSFHHSNSRYVHGAEENKPKQDKNNLCYRIKGLRWMHTPVAYAKLSNYTMVILFSI